MLTRHVNWIFSGTTMGGEKCADFDKDAKGKESEPHSFGLAGKKPSEPKRVSASR